jgi:hypothetical protein
MNPVIDHALVAAIVLAALVFFARRFFRRSSKSCDSGCGCETAKIKPEPRLPV